MFDRPTLARIAVRIVVVAGCLVALLCTSGSVSAEVTRRSFQLTQPMFVRSEGRAFVPLVLSLTETVTTTRTFSVLDTSIRRAMEAPSRPLYCYGPACAPEPFVLLTFMDRIGGVPAAIAGYFCAPPKLGAATYRFGLVSAVGGPAVGLRVRW